MYHEETDTPAMARTSNLNEELGQVNPNRNYCVTNYFRCCSLCLIDSSGALHLLRQNGNVNKEYHGI